MAASSIRSEFSAGGGEAGRLAVRIIAMAMVAFSSGLSSYDLWTTRGRVLRLSYCTGTIPIARAEYVR